MKLRVPNLTEGYRQVLSDIEKIMEKDMIRKEIEEMFNAYGEITNSDEAAAVLILAEVLKGKERHPDAKEVYEKEQQRLEMLQGNVVPEVKQE